MNDVAIVIPNWNGEDHLGSCLDSLLDQSLKAHIIVVENGSIDGSLKLLKSKYPMVQVLVNQLNLGFAGGVNTGIREAMIRHYKYVAVFNNDAVADTKWLEKLMKSMDDDKVGIATCTFASIDKKRLDSTGDLYSYWGLPYPRSRGEVYNAHKGLGQDVFGATGGASLLRISMLEDIGLFDEDFFAYYEDVDLSFRAQLAGWKIRYVPEAVAYHQIGATSSKVKGFTTYQTVKNLPWIVVKDVPRPLLRVVLPRFILAYKSFILSALLRGDGLPALKGLWRMLDKLPQKIRERKQIQQTAVVGADYIWGMMTHDLPPNACRLRKLRAAWRRVTRRKTT